MKQWKKKKMKKKKKTKKKQRKEKKSKRKSEKEIPTENKLERKEFVDQPMRMCSCRKIGCRFAYQSKPVYWSISLMWSPYLSVLTPLIQYHLIQPPLLPSWRKWPGLFRIIFVVNWYGARWNSWKTMRGICRDYMGSTWFGLVWIGHPFNINRVGRGDVSIEDSQRGNLRGSPADSSALTCKNMLPALWGKY